MAISVFDLFKIGIGPSSSHTVGPMRAAALFLGALRERRMLARVRRVEVSRYEALQQPAEIALWAIGFLLSDNFSLISLAPALDALILCGVEGLQRGF